VEELMDCAEALMLANARWDGESISAEEETALEAHLATCSECRAASDSLPAQDAELLRAFAPLRASSAQVASRVIAALDPVQSLPARRTLWPLVLTAAAAGYLLAIFTWPGKEQAARPEVATAPPAVARLAVATGPVEFLPPKQLNWYTCPTATELAPGAAVRTDAGARCEVSTSDGSQVRLNGDSQAHFAGTRQVSLERGELWSQVAESSAPFKLSAPDAKVMSQEGSINLSCQPGQTVVTVVQGSARVESGRQSATLQAGQSAQVVAGQLSPLERRGDPLLATAWINELLAAKGPDDPEFAARINDILAQLGQAKLSHLYEEEIRRLGDSGVLPIVRFIESPRSAGNASLRARAASIVADVAQPRSIPLLIELLADDNPRVRSQAARGLSRLTARDFGRSPSEWETESWASCATTYQAWQDWWKKNRLHYPSAAEPEPSRGKTP
jgi:ferric-dicitrate binding protein FerR (iron transport regulator)